MAYLKFGDSLPASTRGIVLNKALKILNRVFSAGMRDAHVLGGLAFLYWGQGDRRCIELAKQAIESPDCEPEIKSNCLIVLGDMRLKTGDVVGSKAAFEQLTKLRLRYSDWQLLGVCRSLQQDRVGAIAAFEKAISLRPGSVDLRMLISEDLQKSGQHEKAQVHQAFRDRLLQFQRKQPPPR